jgi:hypothetical protein
MVYLTTGYAFMQTYFFSTVAGCTLSGSASSQRAGIRRSESIQCCEHAEQCDKMLCRLIRNVAKCPVHAAMVTPKARFTLIYRQLP